MNFVLNCVTWISIQFCNETIWVRSVQNIRFWLDTNIVRKTSSKYGFFHLVVQMSKGLVEQSTCCRVDYETFTAQSSPSWVISVDPFLWFHEMRIWLVANGGSVKFSGVLVTYWTELTWLMALGELWVDSGLTWQRTHIYVLQAILQLLFHLTNSIKGAFNTVVVENGNYGN